jgi:uncharacterized protein YcaQ
MLELSTDEARMLALSGLGLRGNISSGNTSSGSKPSRPSAHDVINRLGLLQIDSVNVFERAHYMPIFSRIGSFDKDSVGLFTPVAAGERSPFVEYWAHEASVIRTEDLPLYKWRMDRARDLKGRLSGFLESNSDLANWIRAEFAERGPLSIKDIEHDRGKRRGSWWGWSDVKRVLEAMFMFGELTSAGRDSFSRRYALPEQVLPQDVLDRLESAVAVESRKTLIRQAIDVLAVATTKELNDYHRQWGTYSKPDFTRAMQELIDDGSLVPVSVDGWDEPTFIGARGLRELQEAPAGSNPTTILSPFDPTVWYRERAQRLFGFEYKIEIYVPQEKRQFGYYSLPVLHNRKLVGRIDLKSDRQAGLLRVQSAWAENRLDDKQVAAAGAATARHLLDVQKWQGLNAIHVEPIGTLAQSLHQSLPSA